MKNRSTAFYLFCRALEVVLFIACFWFIKYLVVEYINPLPKAAGHNGSNTYFGQEWDEQQQQFDILFFWFLFCFTIAGYYCLLYAAKHKKKARKEKGTERIRAYRKTVLGRLGFVWFMLVPAVITGAFIANATSGTSGEPVGFIAPLFMALGFAPYFVFRGISKAFTLAFCLMFTTAAVTVFVVFILLHIPPQFSFVLGSIPIGVEYSTRLNKAWAPLSLASDKGKP